MESQNKTVYCDECKKDIPVETLEDGTVIIHCPKCTGECVVCDCTLAVKCFSDVKNVKVLHLENDKENEK